MATSHGTGQFTGDQFRRLGSGVVFEPGVLVFHPENIEIGDGVYVGHYAILKGYHKNRMLIGDGTWIGQQCFFHSGGGITIGRNVGIGPGVKILTSAHRLDDLSRPILHAPVEFAPVTVEDDSDLGTGAILLAGVRVGCGAQVGAGSVVMRDVDDYAIVAGVPARFMRSRGDRSAAREGA
jgi:acetyltransferase-like isoleucine patch superfamily enzyme